MGIFYENRFLLIETLYVANRLSIRCGQYDLGSPNWPVLGRMGYLCFGHQNMHQSKALKKEIKLLVKIGRALADFPFLYFLTSFPSQLCVCRVCQCSESDFYTYNSRNSAYFAVQMAQESLKYSNSKCV